jgi:hypothetical protein
MYKHLKIQQKLQGIFQLFVKYEHYKVLLDSMYDRKEAFLELIR